MVAALTEFKKRYGHCCVPYKGSEYRALSGWLVNIRRRKKRGLLDRRLIRQLDKLGVVWEPQNKNWEERFAALAAYRARYGDCNVPHGWSEDRRLASWVNTQRIARRTNSLAPERVERLDQIGFSWARQEDTWESNYAALAEYRRVHGHCRVSTLSEEHGSLGNWVRTMREYKKRGKLSEERIRRLTELDFVWDGALEASLSEVWQEKWESNYAALVEYQRTYGHCDVSSLSKEHVRLCRWVSTMRDYRKQGKLSAERIQRLTQLGFVWDMLEEKWERMYAALVQYKEAHGHCEVPTGWPSNPKLASWVNTQRTFNSNGKLASHRKKRLVALGFRFASQEKVRPGKEQSQPISRAALGSQPI